MWDANKTTTLYATFLPVRYVYRSATGNLIRQIKLTATSNVLKFRQKVAVSFTYNTTRKAGVRVFARPLSGGAPTPHYVASASPLYPVGSGTGRGWFTVSRGATTVTKVRLTMWNATLTKRLFRMDVPVSYQFRRPANIVSSIKLRPGNPNIVRRIADDVGLTFRYTTSEAGGVRISALPFTDDAPTPGYHASSSAVYPVGPGTGGAHFQVFGGAVRVDHIRLTMRNADQGKVLFRTLIPVSYQFK